jgi:hypothetical protein
VGIPADAHSDAEVFQLVATSGDVAAKFSVLDSTGKRVCDRSATTDGWTICHLTADKAHTVLVTGRDQAATYSLTRRDVTATASSAGCLKTAAAKVGGPSVRGTYDAPGTLRCHQVTTGAATDVVHLNVREALGTANIAVIGGDGGVECSFRNTSCAAAGSTGHQVLVETPAGSKAAPEYHLDALRIATADGPAPECTEVPSVAYGYGPITGSLTESRTAVCAGMGGDLESGRGVLLLPVVRGRQGDQRGDQVLAGAEVGTEGQEDHSEGDRSPHGSQGRIRSEQTDKGGCPLTGFCVLLAELSGTLTCCPLNADCLLASCTALLPQGRAGFSWQARGIAGDGHGRRCSPWQPRWV